LESEQKFARIFFHFKYQSLLERFKFHVKIWHLVPNFAKFKFFSSEKACWFKLKFVIRMECPNNFKFAQVGRAVAPSLRSAAYGYKQYFRINTNMFSLITRCYYSLFQCCRSWGCNSSL